MGVIRPATKADASSLTALAIEVWFSTYIKHGISAHFADYALAHFTPERFAAWIADPSHHLLVSQNTGGIDGYVHLNTAAPDPSGKHTTEMVSLYVQTRHQSKGVGSALLQEAQIHHPFWFAVNCENAAALSFYRAQGCTKIGQTSFQIGDEAYPNDIYLAS